MFNNDKLWLFAVASMLYFITLIVNAEYKMMFTILYIIFIVVGLYDLGNVEVEKEKNQEVE
jgi:predicted membrane protein